jgi:hypothetical protein
MWRAILLDSIYIVILVRKFIWYIFWYFKYIFCYFSICYFSSPASMENKSSNTYIYNFLKLYHKLDAKLAECFLQHWLNHFHIWCNNADKAALFNLSISKKMKWNTINHLKISHNLSWKVNIIGKVFCFLLL